MPSLILVALIVIILILVLPLILRIISSLIGLLLVLSIIIASLIASNGLLEFIEANVPNLIYLFPIVLLAALILTIRDNIANESEEYRKALKLDQLYNE